MVASTQARVATSTKRFFGSWQYTLVRYGINYSSDTF
jgi:hypothetical protein